MKEKVSQREKIYRTLASASRPSHQPSLYSILQYYRRENPVIQETQVVKENTPLLNVQRSVAQLASRMISFTVIGVPGETTQGRNNYVGRRINDAYPSHPRRDYGFLQNGAVRVTITFPVEMETDTVKAALTSAGLTIGDIKEGDERGLT